MRAEAEAAPEATEGGGQGYPQRGEAGEEGEGSEEEGSPGDECFGRPASRRQWFLEGFGSGRGCCTAPSWTGCGQRQVGRSPLQ